MPHAAAHYRPQRRKPPEQRPTATQRGYGYAWQRYRAWYLGQPENVLCRECQRAAATVVDHIQPHQGDYDLFWGSANHQPLCASCHSKKTARHDGGFGRWG